jgi:signal peptidase I
VKPTDFADTANFANPTDSADSTEEESAADSSSDSSDDSAAEPEDAKKKQGAFWKELPVLIGVALVLALVIKGFVIQAFYIPSASMENTLQIGDRVLVNKLVYHTRDITRGDIVVFNGIDSWDPEVAIDEPSNPLSKAFRAVGTAFGLVPGEKDYIKRVIGIPGDKVKCCDASGRITVNGHPLDERSYIYVDPETKEQNVPSEDNFDITVPAGRLWVMGDHRGVSYDSRGHSADVGGGTIPISHVVGRAFVVVWPISHRQILSIPSTFDQPGLAALIPYAPIGLGLIGAVPLALFQRHRRLRK